MYGDSFPMLNNMKVIELDGYLPVRFFGKTLLDFGADVYSIKNSNKNLQKNKLSYHLNKGKKIINLDFFKSGNGSKLLNKIIDKADIIIDKQKDSFLAKIDINKNDLLKKYPKLIIIFLSGYGIAENNHKIPIEKTSSQMNHLSSVNSLNKILEFFKNKENTNNRFVNPLIILGDLFGGCISPLYELSQALNNRRKTGSGAILESEITANLFSLSIISKKLPDNNKFHFSCHSKNLDYILFSIDIGYKINKNKNGKEIKNNSENSIIESKTEKENLIVIPENIQSMKNNNEKFNFTATNNILTENVNFLLKKICERLLIEVLNLEELSEGLRLNLTRDYIDYFELITKSLNDSVKYIKDLCKLLDKEEILKQLKKFEFLEIYPVIQFNELIQYFKYSDILKGDNIISSFTDYNKNLNPSLNKSKLNENENKIFNFKDDDNKNNYFEDRLIKYNNNLKIFGIDEDFLENNKLENKFNKEFKPKL